MKHTIRIFAFLALAFFAQNTISAQASSGIKPELVLYRHNSNGMGATAVQQGDTLGNIWFRGLTPTKKIVNGANIRSFITGPVSAGVMPSNLVFRTAHTGSMKNRMVITSEGLVGIGTMSPTFNLHVEGNTHTTGDFYGRIHMDPNPGNAGPGTYTEEAYFEHKTSAEIGAPDMSATGRGGLLTLAPTANTGGQADHQLFFNKDGIYNRRDPADAPAWVGIWHKLLTSEDINGTPNRIAKFTAPSKLGDSQLFDDGTRVGIGTTTPTVFFEVAGNARFNNEFRAVGATTLENTLTVLQASNLRNTTVDGSLQVTNGATIANTATVNGTTNLNGSTNINGNTNSTGTISQTGNTNLNGGKVAIGTTVGAATPGTHLLYVNGSVVATEVKVALQASWPDYVFEQGYQLPNLCETEAYIAVHKHLPGMPSAAEVQQNGGIELGEMNRLLLQKIEELTLLLIEQQKQIDALKGK